MLLIETICLNFSNKINFRNKNILILIIFSVLLGSPVKLLVYIFHRKTHPNLKRLEQIIRIWQGRSFGIIRGRQPMISRIFSI